MSSLRKKRTKTEHTDTSPVTIAHMKTNLKKSKKSKVKILQVLFDSGCTVTIVNREFCKKLRITNKKDLSWTTKAGTFKTKGSCKIQLCLPELHTDRIIEYQAHVDDTPIDKVKYDLIIGRDLMKEVGIDLLFSEEAIKWDYAYMPMRNPSVIHRDNIENLNTRTYQALQVEEEMSRIKSILDAKYAPADLEQVVKDCEELTSEQKGKLLLKLKQFTTLFDGTLGTWRTDPIDLELKPDAKPYYAKPWPVPHVHLATLKDEVERLVDIGVLTEETSSPWGAPTFIVPKKDGTVRFLTDFRELNKRIVRKPFPIPKIQDMLMNLEGFKWASSLDLNMGYYHILLTPNAQKICTLVTPWGKYSYKKLPMGLCNSPDIFQEKTSQLMQGLEFAQAYIDDILITTKSTFDDHLEKLGVVLSRLENAGLKVNAAKSSFGKTALEYLGFWVSREGIQPVQSKVQAMLNIAAPKSKTEVRRFIGLVNFYRDMWIRRSDLLAPLTKLTSANAKFIWTEVEQTAFDKIKKVIARETLLTYPNFSETFHIYTDASQYQLGAVIVQKDKPISFYSRKLNPAQTRYTTTERELLSIVETLKEFRTILLGQKLVVHTDHKNLTYKNFNTDRVIRWRLIVEEFNPEFRYIKGEKNVVADLLSRLDIEPSNETLQNEINQVEQLPARLLAKLNMLDTEDTVQTKTSMAEVFADDPLDELDFPLSYKDIGIAQSQDNDLKRKAKKYPNKYVITSFLGGGKARDLLTYKNKIIIPKSLTKRTVNWYHHFLAHPGINRTEETIRQHLWWPGMKEDIHKAVRTCPICQRNKKYQKKYGKIPEKEAEVVPWKILCVDLIGPYTIRRKKGHKQLKTLHAITMIDPATGWFEIHQIPNKESISIADIVEREWLCRYPWPEIIINDQGSEFKGDFKDLLKEDYKREHKFITTRNPQANAILERIHQTLGNLIRTFELQDNYLDETDPWKGIISAAAFAVRSTYHTTLQKTPGQLVFGRDMIFNIQHEADWKLIKERKQKRIKENNKRENATRIDYTYEVGQKVLVKEQNHKLEPKQHGPYVIREVRNNGTVVLEQGAVLKTWNIRNIQPFLE